MAVGQNQWYHFWGRCTTHFRTYFSGDWDVHWGYDLAFEKPMAKAVLRCTHGLVATRARTSPVSGRGIQIGRGAHHGRDGVRESSFPSNTPETGGFGPDQIPRDPLKNVTNRGGQTGNGRIRAGAQTKNQGDPLKNVKK